MNAKSLIVPGLAIGVLGLLFLMDKDANAAEPVPTPVPTPPTPTPPTPTPPTPTPPTPKPPVVTKPSGSSYTDSNGIVWRIEQTADGFGWIGYIPGGPPHPAYGAGSVAAGSKSDVLNQIEFLAGQART